ncbi:MAG TPA: hypothetical protein VN281_14885 [Verrucomicrobiae bacterium]|nr:hypothetical protein [Verrucomicrobiae bacterium]
MLKSKTRKPGFCLYYRLGVQLDRRLYNSRVLTLSEIGEIFGMTKQNAYTEVVVILGKIVHGLRREVPEHRAWEDLI